MKLFKIVALLIICSLFIYIISPLMINFESRGPTPRKACMEMRHLFAASTFFKERYNTYPETNEGLQLLLKKKIIKVLPVDPWGNPYQYIKVSNDTIKIISYGSDGKEGGIDSASDLYFKDCKT